MIRGIKNRFNKETMNENVEQLIYLCDQNELQINNIFYLHKTQPQIRKYRRYRLIINYIIINTYILLQYWI